MKPELIVKGGHSVDFAGCKAKVFGYPVDGFRGQIGELFLDSLKNGNKIYTVVSKGLKACIQFLEFFSADVVCHGIVFLLKLDPLHGAVDALEAVTKKEAKPLQNAEPQSRIAEHQSPDLGSIEKDGFGRFLARGGGQETVGYAQEGGPATKGPAFSDDPDHHIASARSQIYGSLQSDLAFSNNVNAITGVSLAKDHLTGLKGLVPAKTCDLFKVLSVEPSEKL
jgi:hypothetical protein